MNEHSCSQMNLLYILSIASLLFDSADADYKWIVQNLQSEMDTRGWRKECYKIFHDNYNVDHQKTLGSGNAGKVLSIYRRRDGAEMAIKRIGLSRHEKTVKETNIGRLITKLVDEYPETAKFAKMVDYFTCRNVFDRHDDTVYDYIVFHRVIGTSLSAYCKSYSSSLSVGLVKKFLQDVVGSIELAHRKYGFIHNDLDASNVMKYSSSDEVAIIDLGDASTDNFRGYDSGSSEYDMRRFSESVFRVCMPEKALKSWLYRRDSKYDLIQIANYALNVVDMHSLTISSRAKEKASSLLYDSDWADDLDRDERETLKKSLSLIIYLQYRDQSPDRRSRGRITVEDALSLLE